MADRRPPRRRVPGPARPARPATGTAKARGQAAPRGPRTIRLGSPRPRLRLVAFALTMTLLVFVVRLLQVQAVDATAYAAKAEQNRAFSHTVAAERGEITDRNGVALATSVDAYDITADPSMFSP